MKKYTVSIKCQKYFTVDIVADNEEEAELIAYDLAESDKRENFSEEDCDWEVLDCEELD